MSKALRPRKKSRALFLGSAASAFVGYVHAFAATAAHSNGALDWFSWATWIAALFVLVAVSLLVIGLFAYSDE